MSVREYRDEVIRRVEVLLALFNVCLLVIAGGFWLTQIFRGEHYRQLAENNRLRTVSLKAPRGLIYDREGRILVENVPSYNLLLDRDESRDVEGSLKYAAGILERPAEELSSTLERARKVPFKPVLLAEDLTLSQVSHFRLEGLEHPEFEIEVRHQRYYRHGPQTAHVLGYLGEVSEDDLARTPERYAPGDLVGRKGIEAAYDLALRGQDGEQVVVVDSRGRFLEEYGRERAKPGENLTLTLDLALQEVAEKTLAPRTGAVVALDPRTGEVLALVSTPSYDPNLFARHLDAAQWQELISSPKHPLQNRALQSAFSPGSVFKIVMGVAGLSEGVVTPSDRVYCKGFTRLYNNRFRCHKRAGHGWVNLSQALEHSCDVYFYHLGQKLGIERIAEYSERFHFGRATGIDLGGERSGLVPDMGWSLKARGHPWYPGETISVAIGQGPLLTTPLQLASMVAAVANGGDYVTPHLVRDSQPPRRASLGLQPVALDTVRQAMWEVVNGSRGTGRNARIPGLEVAGKTGTTQVVTQRTWTSNDELPPELRDHAWFVSFAPYDDPSLVVVVFAENAGMGSAEAAPVAKALYEQYFRVSDDEPGRLSR